MSSMAARFQRSRWSYTRARIDGMERGEAVAFSADEYFNAKASVERLNDAYGARRKWTMKTRNKVTTVRRVI